MDVEPVGLHGSMLCPVGSSLPRCCPYLASMLGLCWICHHDPGSWLGLCLCWICYVGPICCSMLDLLRCPQMCSKASVGVIGFMLDVSHVGHIFLFFWFPGGSPPKGPKPGEGGLPYFLNLVILVTLTMLAFTANHHRSSFSAFAIRQNNQDPKALTKCLWRCKSVMNY